MGSFNVKNPTLKNIIEFLKNQLSNVATDADISVGDTESWYGRKNGVWSKIQGSGGGGESTNIGDEVYTNGNNLIIKSASTEIKDFFGQIANDFNDALSYSTGQLVMNEKELYRFTSDYTAGSGDSLTTHAVTTTIDLGLQQKVNKSGDVMDGNLTINKSEPTITLTHTLLDKTVSSLTTEGNPHISFMLNDKNNNLVSYMQVTQDRTNGSIVTTYGTRNFISNSTTEVVNYFQMRVNKDGIADVTFSHPEAWRNRLNVFNKLECIPSIMTYESLGHTNLDTSIYPGMIVTTDSTWNTSLKNAIGSNYAYVFQHFYNNASTNAPHLQVAFPYENTNNKFAWRTYYNGWGNWHIVSTYDSGWQSIVDANNFTGDLKYRKIGTRVELRGNIFLTSTLNANSGRALNPNSIIPEEYRANSAVSTVSAINTDGFFGTGLIIVATDGRIYIYSNTNHAFETTYPIHFTLTYLCES